MSVKSVKSQIDVHIATHQVATHIHKDLRIPFNGFMTDSKQLLQFFDSDANIAQITR